MTQAAPSSALARNLRLALAVAGATLVVAALVLYSARRTVAREALTAWLKSKGVPASAQIEAIGPTGVVGSIVVGDPSRPDLVVERAEVDYGLIGFQVREVRLVRPVLRARLRGGRLAAGALDPLIAEFRKAPPRPNAAQPKIAVEGGVLLLATDYGPVRIEADAALADGKLRRLTARTAPARLRGKDFDVSLGPSALAAQAVADRIELSLDAPIDAASGRGLAAANARLRVRAAGPYPDVAARRIEGAVVAHAEIGGGRLAVGDQALRNVLVSAGLTGRSSGWLDTLTITGRAMADLRAGGVEAAGGQGGPVRASVSAEDLRWTRKGGDAVRARLAARATAGGFARQELRISVTTSSARGGLALDSKGLDLDLAVAAQGRGAWTGLGPPVAQDFPDIVAVKRAAEGFRFTAPALAVRAHGGAIQARLVQPVRLLPDGGGAVTLSPAGAGWRLAASGGGLPRVEADVRRFQIAPDGATAAGSIRAALSIGPIETAVFDASGALRIAAGGASFTGDRCVEATAKRLVFGENAAERLAGRICPTGSPLLSLSGGDWRITGRAEAVQADVPFLQAHVERGAGDLDLALRHGALAARMRVTGAEVSDTAPATRFRPVRVTGQAGLAGDLWTSTLQIRDPAGHALAVAVLRHQASSGRGGVQIDSGSLHFAPDGLQPAELSPLAAAIGSPAEGEASFSGAFRWTPKEVSSSGALRVLHLDFQSPAGALRGLSGRVAFTSLAPLTAAPGQTLQAQSVATPLGPVTDLKLVFSLDPEVVRVSGGQAAIGGGLARIESLEFPFDPQKPVRGVVSLEGVQLHDLVEASPFGDRVDLDARVSGRIPFTTEGEKIRVEGGTLSAVQPGRLSIQRTALTGVAASGAADASGAPGAAAVAAADTDTFSDFAYQAMENLAFSTLTAKLDSRPDGRLAALFHIIGKHDPPQHQEIRLTVMELIQRKFLGRKLPLPSGTGVDLTLDTTLNLDDLLADYAEFRRLHGSAQVQP